MKYLHTLDPDQLREMEESRKFDEEMDESYEAYLESHN